MADRQLTPATEDGFVKSDRWNRGAWLFRDSTLEQIEGLLDEAFRVPGTRFRVGLDGIVGIIPGFGDVFAGLLSLIIPIAAWTCGVPYVTIVRMAVNVGIGVLVGTIPVFGDIFDIAWKANRRNYRLLRLHLGEPRGNTWRDWAFLAVIAAALTAVFTLSILFVYWALTWLINH
jgi:hypothetical protein